MNRTFNIQIRQKILPNSDLGVYNSISNENVRCDKRTNFMDDALFY